MSELQATVAEAPEISVMVHHDEARYIEMRGRCDQCGHLEALHDQQLPSRSPCALCECDG